MAAKEIGDAPPPPPPPLGFDGDATLPRLGQIDCSLEFGPNGSNEGGGEGRRVTGTTQ